MAIKIFAYTGSTLAKFAQSSLAVVNTGLVAKPFANSKTPMAHFAISSLTVPAVPALGLFAPFPPLPLFRGGGVGGQAGYPL